MKRVYIETNGCGRRRIDATKIARYFLLNGYDVVEDLGNSDIVIFVGCGSTRDRENESLEMLDSLKKNGKEIIVMGCFPGTSPKLLKENFDGVSFDVKNYNQIDSLFPDFKFKFSEIKEPNFLYCSEVLENMRKGNFDLDDSVEKNVKSARLVISEGCINNCSYCAIKHAVGVLKSKSLEELGEEYENLIKRGYSDIWIYAEDVGSYGIDIKSNLPELLALFDKIDKKLKKKTLWSLSTMHPRFLIKYEKEILKFIKSGKIKVMETDIQSGNNRILKLMNRHHKINDLKKVLKKIFKINPKFKLSTQCIVGFPGETYKEFLDTLDFVLKLGFYYVQIMPYSDMEGTVSSNMKEKISEEEKNKRMDYLRDVFTEKDFVAEITPNFSKFYLEGFY